MVPAQKFMEYKKYNIFFYDYVVIYIISISVYLQSVVSLNLYCLNIRIGERE